MTHPTDSTPRITVITVVYNDVRHIVPTVESTLAQDYPDLEYVVVDGGSRDGTVEAIREHAPRIDVLISEPDRGIYDAMNKGIARASGEFLLFMNCGDVFAHAGALSALAGGIVAGAEQAVFGSWLRKAGDAPPARLAPDLDRGLFNHQSVLYSRSLHARFGGYVSTRGFTTADYLFFATLLAAPGVRSATVDTSVAVIDVGGVSAGPQTLSQKVAIDYLYGRASRLRLLAILALHPAYRWLKTRLKRPS